MGGWVGSCGRLELLVPEKSIVLAKGTISTANKLIVPFENRSLVKPDHGSSQRGALFRLKKIDFDMLPHGMTHHPGLGFEISFQGWGVNFFLQLDTIAFVTIVGVSLFLSLWVSGC